MCVTGLVSAAAGIHTISGILLNEMFTMVRMDLNTAHAVYEQSLQDVERTVRFASESPPPRHAPEGLDALVLLDARGRPPRPAAIELEAPLVRVAVRDQKAISSTIIISNQDLKLIGHDLAARAAALGRADSGLMLASVSPVRDRTDKVTGYLFGGRLLSRDTGLVDRIMGMLYHGLQRRGHDAGVVTLFQDGIRISTTLRLPDGERAVGTRGTSQALEMPPTKESSNVERANALGVWYITAHETITDFQDRPVASLFVGILESRYIDRRRQVVLIFLSFVACGMAAALLFGHWLSRRIVRPLRTLTETARRLAAGELTARAQLSAEDEFGDLGAAFDRMARNIQRNELQVKRDVERHIADSERLAMVGQLAAGIAHEINNPLGGVLVYSHLLLDDTPEGDPRRPNLKKIAQETARCRDIVRSLLDFARQGELQVEDADINALIAQSLDLAGTQKSFRNIRIVKRFSEKIPPIRIDRGKIQQVLLNVIFNAAEAMEGRAGAITVATRVARAGTAVQTVIRDTGCGMPPDVLKRVFEPFFTTKEVGKGVGLGLSVSYGIVEKHTGKLRIRSRAGQGTVVSILLPVKRGKA